MEVKKHKGSWVFSQSVSRQEGKEELVPSLMSGRSLVWPEKLEPFCRGAAAFIAKADGQELGRVK